MSDLIGKTVTFSFSTTPQLTGIIKRVPVATGDSFVLNCDGVEFWIQQFDWMRVTSATELGESDE